MKTTSCTLIILLFTAVAVFTALAGAAAEDASSFSDAYGRYQERVAEGDFEAALPAAQEAYEIGLERFGAVHGNTAGLMYNYGHMLLETGNLERAAEILELARERYVEVYGADSPNSIDPLMMLGRVWAELKQPKNEFYDQAIALAKSEKDRNLMAALNFDAGVRLLEAAGSLDAGPYLRAALKIYDDELGETDPTSARTAFYLAKVEFARKRPKPAEHLFKRAAQTLGHEHPIGATAHVFLIQLYTVQRDFDKIAPHCALVGQYEAAQRYCAGGAQ